MMKAGVICVLFAVISTCSGWANTDNKNVVTFKSEPYADHQQQQVDPWCEMCELAMERIKVLIKEKDQEGKVNTTLYNLCDIMKGPMRLQCYTMVPLIKQQLTQGFDSHQACLMLQFCGGGTAPNLILNMFSKMNDKGHNVWKDLGPIFGALQPHIMTWVQQYSTLKAQADFSVTCMLCKAAVGLVDKSLEQYKKPLTDYVIGICEDLPTPTNEACSEAMGFYIPSWWDSFFTNIASANELCYVFNMCKEDVFSTPPRSQTTKQQIQ